jgi:hypothetical protein
MGRGARKPVPAVQQFEFQRIPDQAEDAHREDGMHQDLDGELGQFGRAKPVQQQEAGADEHESEAAQGGQASRVRVAVVKPWRNEQLVDANIGVHDVLEGGQCGHACQHQPARLLAHRPQARPRFGKHHGDPGHEEAQGAIECHWEVLGPEVNQRLLPAPPAGHHDQAKQRD